MEKEDKIDKLARAVKTGFDRVDERLDRMDERLEHTATKDDLVNLRTDFDIMLDRHIGTFRKDYDELSARVKKLEEAMFK